MWLTSQKQLRLVIWKFNDSIGDQGKHNCLSVAVCFKKYCREQREIKNKIEICMGHKRIVGIPIPIGHFWNKVKIGPKWIFIDINADGTDMEYYENEPGMFGDFPHDIKMQSIEQMKDRLDSTKKMYDLKIES